MRDDVEDQDKFQIKAIPNNWEEGDITNNANGI